MPILYYVQTSAIGLGILVIIGFHMLLRNVDNSGLKFIFNSLLVSNMLLLLLEMLLNLLNGADGNVAGGLLPAIVCIFYILNPVPEALWIFYLNAIIRRNEQKGMSRTTAIVICVPVLANAALSLGSLFKGYLFFVDEGNVYHRGELFILMPLLCYIYLLYYIVMIVVKRKFISRKEFLALLFSAFPPLLAGLLQSLFFGVSLLWIALAFSLLIVYMNLQSEQVYRELVRLDYLKNQFLANTSHELRTPLNGIINLTNTVLEQSRDGVQETHREDLQMVVDAARRLDRLVNDILDISGIQSGGLKLHRGVIEIKPIVEASIRIVSQLNNGKQIEFVNQVPDSLPPVWADEERVYQIFYNLIGNALKFTASGSIAIGAEAMQEQVEIWVEDTGKGIPRDQLEEVFKPFYQSDSSETREVGGVGLGLPITKMLIELHGGAIRVTSAEGQGSRFFFTLPAGSEDVVKSKVQPFEASYGELQLEAPLLAGLPRLANTVNPAHPVNPAKPANSPSRPNPAGSGGKGRRRRGYSILAADDDPANLNVLLRTLDYEGYDVTVVSDGEAALAELERNRGYDLVILDVMMPKLSGYEVLKSIRTYFTMLDMPVLLLTARSRPEDLQVGFEAGANDYLTKPFEAVELKSRVKTLVEMKKAINERISAELSFLQAQIKPHFLFNALNVIAALITKDPPRARQLLCDLSDYLRGSFQVEDYQGMISLENELLTVQAYVAIEMERFREKLHVEMDIDSEIRGNIEIPMLVIQPLVENAIRHGIMSKTKPGTVSLIVRKAAGCVAVIVRDDGAGIPGEKLARLLEEQTKLTGQTGLTDQTWQSGRSGIGLRNIQRRLLLQYGKGLHIQSAPGEGTTVTLVIPYEGD